MRLPSYEQRGAQSHPTQSLESATAVSRAMDQTVQTAAKVGTGIYESVSVADYNRGMAERSKASEELQRQYEENEYMLASELGDLANETNTELRPMPYTDDITGETGTRPTPVVPTSEVMSAHYAREMGNIDKAVGESLRTNASRHQYEQQVALKVGPEGQASVDGFAFERNREIEASRTFDRVQAEIDSGNDEGAIEAIRLGVTAGHIPREDETKLIEAARTEIFERDINEALSADMDLADREEIGNDIANAPGIDDELKAKYIAEWQKVYYDDNRQLVADALIDRDYGRIEGLLTEYTQRDYDGPLEDTQRHTLIKTLESGLKGISSGNAAAAEVDRENAQRTIKQAMSLLEEGGNAVTHAQLVGELPQLMNTAFSGGATNKTERNLLAEVQKYLNSAPVVMATQPASIADGEAAAQVVEGRATTTEEQIQAAYTSEQIRKQNKRKEANTLDEAINASIVEPPMPLDFSNPDMLAASIESQYDAGRDAAKAYGTPGQILSPEVTMAMGRAFASGSTDDKLTMIGAISTGVKDIDDQLRLYSDMLDSGDSHLPVAGVIAANGHELAAADLLSASDFVRSEYGQAALEQAGWDKKAQRKAYLRVVERAGQLSPAYAAEYSNAAVDLAGVFIADGMDPDKAVERALDRITGGEVANSGSDWLVPKPTDNITTAQFRNEQQSISDAHYRSIGWDYDEHPSRLVAQGHVIFRQTPDGKRGSYNLFDTRTSEYLAGDEGIIRLEWSERKMGQDKTEQGAVGRGMTSLGIAEKSINDKEFQAEQARIRERRAENKRIREEQKARRLEERREAWGDLDIMGGLGGETGSFAP